MNRSMTLASMLLLAIGLMPAGCRDDHATAEDHGDHQLHDDHAHPGHGEHLEHDEHDGHDEHDHVDEVTLSAEAIERSGIRIESATKRSLSDELAVPGRVSFNLEAIAHVSSVVPGRVSQINVGVGDEVSPGDVLLTVASPELGRAQSDYLQKRAAIGAAEASVKVSKALHDSARALYEESRGIALSQVQRREADWQAAEGELTAARGALAAAENLLHLLGMNQQAVDALAESNHVDPTLVVRSPLAGRVIERSATIGEAVGPDRDSLLVIADMSTLWVIGDVPEPRIGQVTSGSEATVVVPALNDRSYTGKLDLVGWQLDPATRTVPVRIAVRGDGRLRPGMFARVILTIGAGAEAVLAVPESAVQVVDGSPCLFMPVEGEANTFARRVVDIGPQVGRMTPVLKGLSEGERYVAAGSFILKAELGKAGASHGH